MSQITVKKIGNKNEYTETLRCACGHVQEVVTLGYKMDRRQVKIKQQLPCLRCQIEALLPDKGDQQC